MKIRQIIQVFAIAVCLILGVSSAFGQIGLGAGVAATGGDLFEAGEGLVTLAGSDSIRYGDVAGSIGVYAIMQFKYGYGGPYRLNLDVSYVFFPSKEIVLRDGDLGSSTATFEVGATTIPIAIGGEIVLPADNIRPYFGAQISYTIFNRTFAFVDGNSEMNRPEIHNEWEGHNEWGIAVRGGLEMALGTVALDLGLRYNMANLITKNDDESSMNYLQAGAALFFGDLLNKDPEPQPVHPVVD